MLEIRAAAAHGGEQGQAMTTSKPVGGEGLTDEQIMAHWDRRDECLHGRNVVIWFARAIERAAIQTPAPGAEVAALTDERAHQLRMTATELANLAYQHGREELSPWPLGWQILEERIVALAAIGAEVAPDQTALREALAELVEAVTVEVNEKGAGGYLLARLTDARAALATPTEPAGEPPQPDVTTINEAG